MDVPWLFDSESRCGELEYCDDASIVTCPSGAREHVQRKSRHVDTIVKARPTWSAGMRG